MPEETEDREYKRWLVREGYQDVLAILSASWSGLNQRLGLLERDLADARRKLDAFKLEHFCALKDPARLSSVGKDLTLHRLAGELYYAVLECIMRLAILTEVTLLYYGSLRVDPKRLAEVLAERWGVDYQQETDRIQKLRLTDVWLDFKLPNVRGYACSSQKKTLLRRVLRETAKSLRNDLRDLATFRRRFSVVYNKYKHSLVEVTDRYVVVDRGGTVGCIPQFYVRSKERAPRSGKEKTYSYAVRTDERFLDYMELLVKKWATVTVSLLDNHVQWLANRRGPAFPRRVTGSKEDVDQIREALNGEPSFPPGRQHLWRVQCRVET